MLRVHLCISRRFADLRGKRSSPQDDAKFARDCALAEVMRMPGTACDLEVFLRGHQVRGKSGEVDFEICIRLGGG